MLSTQIGFLLLSTLHLATGAPIQRREVPQEHSHEKYLTSVRKSLALNNPDGIVDPVFGLLGNAAAAGGQGKIANTDCLQQATADQAFTNAKAAGDVQAMADALVYRALEKNTGKVGLASVACTVIKAKNPEVAAISQHQDPASPNAAAINKATVLELARQIQSIGGDPLQALESGTFAPGDLNDATAKGNSCNDANDAIGCIFSQNKLVEDASEAEIIAAIDGVAAADGAGAVDDGDNTAIDAGVDAAGATATCPPAVTITVTAGATATPDVQAGLVVAGPLDLGTCTNPTIVFGPGFDGRKENSFLPANRDEFTQGSALNIKIITNFICDRLNDQCKAPAATVAICRVAEQAAVALGGRDAASAAAFNDIMLGQVTPVVSAATPTATPTQAAGNMGKADKVKQLLHKHGKSRHDRKKGGKKGSGANAGMVTQVPKASSTTPAIPIVTSTAVAAAAAAAVDASEELDLQQFADGLGGVLAPAVVARGQQFCIDVDGNVCFGQLRSALSRSCAIQHNQCANASNAAGQSATFSVGACDAQEIRCSALAQGA